MIYILGIDIAKAKFDVALMINDKFLTKQFANNAEGFDKLKSWYQAKAVDQLHACLEATGIYGEQLARYLQAQGHKVSVVNPARIKAFAGSKLSRNKTDSADAKLIAQFCYEQNPAAWQAPSPELKRLQAIVRHLDVLKHTRQQQLNHLESATEAIVVNSFQQIIAYLDKEIAELNNQIFLLFEQHPTLNRNKELLQTIPGIGKLTAIKFLAEVPEIIHYQSAKQLAAHLGVSPRRDESGELKRRTRLAKIGNQRVRKALYFPAITAKNHNAMVKAFCQRLADKGKSKMAIIGAAMHKLVHIIYGVLKHQQPFNENLVA